jgi:hypothetical protein
LSIKYKQFSLDLQRFYDFTNKTVLFVGAGGRQLLDPAIQTKKLIAIDQDIEALKQLQTDIASRSLPDSVEVMASRFEDVALSGDVVYFEFCLHEMMDPYQVLLHARSLAPDILVFDHSPGSDWSFYAAEDDKVRHSSEALDRFGVRKRKTFCTEQRFRHHAELQAKLAGQGAVATERARRFAGATDIVIPMNYQLALL